MANAGTITNDDPRGILAVDPVLAIARRHADRLRPCDAYGRRLQLAQRSRKQHGQGFGQ
jgi:hypothetical protein